MNYAAKNLKIQPSIKNKKLALDHYGIFIQDQWNINDRSKIILGTRGDFHDDFGWELSPKISGMFKLNEQLSLRGGVSKGFKAPSLKQLTPEYESNAAMGGRGIIHGNPDLKSETNLAHEVGLYFHQANFETSVTWFKN